jgi:hypothetical protein
MKQVFYTFLQKCKREPPFAAACLTIFIFTCPVLVSIITTGEILLPSGYTRETVVPPIYGLAAIAINVILLFILGTAPIFNARFQSIVTPDFFRKLLICIYVGLTFYSLYVMNAKLDLINSLIEDPIVTMLKVGGDLGDDNLLHYFYYGMSGCIAFALVKNDDGIFLRLASYTCMVAIVLFYFFIGRREVCVMALVILFLLRAKRISRTAILITGAFIIGVIVFVLSLRSGDDSGSMFSTNSEELSPVAYSSYVIQKTSPDIAGSFTNATFLRAYLNPLDISTEFFKDNSGYSDPATPVLSIAGITYMYGFIIPFLTVLIFGSFFRTVCNEFQKKKTPIIKLLLIYVVFRAFNLFRNGEFAVVEMDTIKFLVLLLPAIYLKFENNSAQDKEIEQVKEALNA